MSIKKRENFSINLACSFMLLARTKTYASCGISPLGDFVNSEAARVVDGITTGRASCPPDISRGSKEKNLSYHD